MTRGGLCRCQRWIIILVNYYVATNSLSRYRVLYIQSPGENVYLHFCLYYNCFLATFQRPFAYPPYSSFISSLTTHNQIIFFLLLLSVSVILLFKPAVLSPYLIILFPKITEFAINLNQLSW